METYSVRIFTGDLGTKKEYVLIDAVKSTSAEEILKAAVVQLGLGKWNTYQLVETFSSGGQICKERRLLSSEKPRENSAVVAAGGPTAAGYEPY